jgi:hypothetical protein
MLQYACAWLKSLFSPQPVRLAITRRYCDANGNYIGELYMGRENKATNVMEYSMIGVSLDSMPADYAGGPMGELLDTRYNFLAFMPKNTIRVGALDPSDNDRVRRMVAELPRRDMSVMVRNSFIPDLKPFGQVAKELDRPC